MAVACPACGKAVVSADVNVQADLAKCAACGEVFSPSQALSGRMGGASGRRSPAGELLRDSKIVVEEFGGSLVVRFPAHGFSFGLVFLVAFAIGWWSFLLFFVGGVLSIGNGAGNAQQASIEHATTLQAEPEDAPRPASQSQPANHRMDKVFPWFMLLFLTPFFLAGLAMIGGVLWPLFGRSEVRLDDFECRYRASLFGLGRTLRAPIEDTRLKWKDALDHPMARYAAGVASLGGGGGGCSRILLTLGRREKAIGASASESEQEWVFNLLSARLGRSTRTRR